MQNLYFLGVHGFCSLVWQPYQLSSASILAMTVIQGHAINHFHCIKCFVTVSFHRVRPSQIWYWNSFNLLSENSDHPIDLTDPGSNIKHFVVSSVLWPQFSTLSQTWVRPIMLFYFKIETHSTLLSEKFRPPYRSLFNSKLVIKKMNQSCVSY